MKKYFLIVLSIFLTALMPACAQTQRDPYKIYVAGYSDSISKANHSLEIDLSNEMTYKGSVKKTKTVNVFGNEYEVTYKETKKDIYTIVSGIVTNIRMTKWECL